MRHLLRPAIGLRLRRLRLSPWTLGSVGPQIFFVDAFLFLGGGGCEILLFQELRHLMLHASPCPVVATCLHVQSLQRKRRNQWWRTEEGDKSRARDEECGLVSMHFVEIRDHFLELDIADMARNI